MALPLIAPLLDSLSSVAGNAAERAASGALTVALAAVALMLVVAAGLVALTAEVGFPLAALVFAALFTLLALVAHWVGRGLSTRRASQLAAAQHRAQADIALAATLARSAGPFLPLAAFIAAFVMTRRP